MSDRPLIEITIPGDPVPKARPRLGRGRAFTPARTRAAEDAIRWQLRAAIRQPINGPVEVELRFRRATRRTVDIDNLAKLVLDACNGTAWHDDSQVVRLDAQLEPGTPTTAATTLRIHRPKLSPADPDPLAADPGSSLSSLSSLRSPRTLRARGREGAA